MAISEAKKRANEKWNKANMKERYDRIQLVVPKGMKETLQSKAKEQGLSMNKYIMEAIRLYMGDDAWEGGSDSLQSDVQENT